VAGDWIKVEHATPDKPEVWQMAGILNMNADEVFGKLFRVWRWFDQHTENGNAVGVSYSLIDRVAGVAGFAEAMTLSGWLNQNGHLLSLPNFSRHNGKTAKNRALTNERVAKHRNAETVTKTVTREEKRRSNTPPTPLRGFEVFWNEWPPHPRKAAKPQCEAKWKSLGCEALAGQIAASVGAFKASEQWRKDEGAFVPAPLVWLNQRRWEATPVVVENRQAEHSAAYLKEQQEHARSVRGVKPPAELLALVGKAVKTV
jgi:hypothetical protein